MQARFIHRKTVRDSLRYAMPIAMLAVAMGTRAEAPDTTRTYRIPGEVIVTGSNLATGRERIPYSVTTVNRERLEAAGRTELLAALSARVPGLFVSERNVLGFGLSNGGAGGIKIRGVGGSPTNAVLMMVDGQPQFAGIYSHPVADFYATEHAERVEVLRGPGSVLYGSNAMGGVVNVITRDAGRDGLHGSLSTQGGSYGTWLSSLNANARFGRWTTFASAGYNRTDGTEPRFGFKQSTLYAKTGYDLGGAWSLAADYSLMHFAGDDPVYPRLSDPASTAVYHQNVTRGAASLALQNRNGRTSGSVRAYYSYGNHFVDDPRHFHSTDDRLGLLAYQNFHPWEGASATAGLDISTYTGRIPVSGGTAHAEGSLTTLARRRISEYAPYVTLSQHLVGGMITLHGGLRLAAADPFGARWVPQGGLTVRPGGEWTLKASLAKGYRNPSFRELYLYRTANPDLDPEEMMNYEVTVGRDWGRAASVELTAYYSKGDNLIQTVDMHNENTGHFIHKGVELSSTYSPVRQLSLHATYSYLHTSLQGLTGAPKNQYSLAASWQATGSLRVDASLRGAGGLYVSDEQTGEDYVLVDVRVAWRPARAVELFASVDNLTGRRYVINRGYDMPGRTAFGGIRLHY